MNALKNVTRCLRKLKFRTIKHAPEIFMYAGIAGTVTATVIACKKTENIPEIMEDHKKELEEVKAQASEMPMNEYRKELTKVYASTGLKVFRNYAMPAALGIASVASIMYGHNMLRKWYVDTSMALAAVTDDYNKLYDNLVAEVGEEKAKEIKAGIISEEVEETITDAKGKDKVVVTKKKRLLNPSAYTFKWNNETADEWVKDFEQNYFVVKSRAAQMENNLAVRETGHLFWIEAVEYLCGSRGLKKILDERAEAGKPLAINLGWLYDPDKATNINIDYIPDPEDPYSLIITLIPDGNIVELSTRGKQITA